MAIYKTWEFARWARKQHLSDTQLLDAVLEMAKGLYALKKLASTLLSMPPLALSKAQNADELIEVNGDA